MKKHWEGQNLSELQLQSGVFVRSEAPLLLKPICKALSELMALLFDLLWTILF